jgi:hypothetical protein
LPKSEKPLTRLCLRLLTEDLDFIEKLDQFADQGTNAIIRQMVHTMVLNMRAIERRNLDQIKIPDAEAAQ